jgi:hypothetical protein
MFFLRFKITANRSFFQVKLIAIVFRPIIVAHVSVKYFLTPKARYYRFVAISDLISTHFQYFVQFRVFAQVFPNFILF